MIDWFLWAQLAISAVAFVLNLGFLAFSKKPHILGIALVALLEVGLVAQLAITIGMLITGAPAKGDVIEYFGYLITALLVPAAAVIWALVEKTRQGSLVLLVASFTVGIMLARMWMIWFG